MEGERILIILYLIQKFGGKRYVIDQSRLKSINIKSWSFFKYIC